AGRRGARVVAVDVDAAAAAATAADAGGIAVPCDVTDERQVAGLFDTVAEHGLVADAVVAAAGVDLGGFAHELPVSRWRAVLEVNLTGTFLLCRQAIAALL